MITIELKAREKTGNKAKRVLNEGYVPAVIYDNKTHSANFKVERGAIERLLHHVKTSSIVKASIEGDEKQVLVKDVDYHPITGQIRHIAFFEIDPNELMTFELPVRIVGESPAVKNNLGVLIQPTKSITVRAKVSSLVEDIEINVEKLTQPGQSITLESIALPEGIELLHKDQLDVALATVGQLQKLVEEEEQTTSDEETEGEGGEDGEATESAEGGEDNNASTEVAAEEK
ncbi:50S ribosomal protein L25 [Candidatus Dojkabacteria bacterium]|uniref:Large ribosomal subunit protein bL25 n=1 Tax=Candidatus Dojkabacteria bacterium TaxID=2099670 RepID=A0A955I5K5_9BACT|nr:50S ribosomal protein L25 [Candidatus Dojkabacteria bacterium]MCB9790883.1 50S ribosomal protein L25 [Candidatus Nomurabacteria bacterium]